MIRIKGILVSILVFLFLFIIHYSLFYIPTVFAQVLQANCTNYLICDAGFTNCQTPAGHGPLFQGRTYDFKITMQNVGDTTWFPTVTAVNPGGPFKFGAACPKDRTTWGTGICDGDGNAADSGQGDRPNRVDLTRDVLPGESYEFSLSATTPASARTDYLMVYRMVQDGVDWFGAACVPSLQVDNTLAQPPPACTCTYPENCTLSDGSPGVHTCSGVSSGTTCVFDGSGACTPNCSACAAAPAPSGGTFEVGPSPAGIPQLENLFISIVFAAVGLGFIAMFAFLVWAGFKYLTSGGEPKAIHSAHQTLTWALLGVIFLAVAWLVLQLIAVFTGINVTFFNLRTLF